MSTEASLMFAILFFVVGKSATAKSMEIMAGDQVNFANLQWLKPFNQQHCFFAVKPNLLEF